MCCHCVRATLFNASAGNTYSQKLAIQSSQCHTSVPSPGHPSASQSSLMQSESLEPCEASSSETGMVYSQSRREMILSTAPFDVNAKCDVAGMSSKATHVLQWDHCDIVKT